LLKAGVFLGVAAPPAYVVAAPVVGGIVGGFAVSRLIKKMLRKDD
jgi:hypothetical protein